MSAMPFGNHANSQASHTSAGDLASFIQVDMGVGAFRCSFFARDNPLLSFASRTSSFNPPCTLLHGDAGVTDVMGELYRRFSLYNSFDLRTKTAV